MAKRRKQDDDDERGREKWDLRAVGIDRVAWDEKHPGALAYDVLFDCHYIDCWGEFFWRITPLNAERTRIRADVVLRNAGQEAVGCDGCVRSHKATTKYCSANNRKEVSWLRRVPKTRSDEHYVLYALREGRAQYPGVWVTESDEGNDGRHRSWTKICRRV